MYPFKFKQTGIPSYALDPSLREQKRHIENTRPRICLRERNKDIMVKIVRGIGLLKNVVIAPKKASFASELKSIFLASSSDVNML